MINAVATLLPTDSVARGLAYCQICLLFRHNGRFSLSKMALWESMWSFIKLQRIATNCTNCHENGKKFVIICVNSLLN